MGGSAGLSDRRGADSARLATIIRPLGGSADTESKTGQVE
jgi:hypothetical protein